MAEPDIRLLIGASLGGPAGDSAQKIREEIEGAFASKPLKLSAVLDDKSVNAIRKKLQDAFGSISFSSNVAENARKEITNILNKPIEANVQFNSANVQKLRDELSGLGVGDNFINQLSSEMDDMSIKIQNVRRDYDKIVDSGDEFLRLTISGVANGKDQVNITRQYQKIVEDNVVDWQQVGIEQQRVSTNLKKIEQDAERIANQQSSTRNALAQDVASYIQKLNQSEVLAQRFGDDFQKLFSSIATANPEQLTELVNTFNGAKGDVEQYRTELVEVNKIIDQISQSERKMFQARKDQASSDQNSNLHALATKEIEAQAAEQRNLLGTLQEIESLYPGILSYNEKFNDILKDTSSLSYDVQKYLAKLQDKSDAAETSKHNKEAKAIAALVENLDQEEKKLKSVGLLTDELKNKFDALRNKISSGNPSSISQWDKEFKALKEDAAEYQSQLSDLNKLYSELSTRLGKETSLQKKTLDTNLSEGELAKINSQLEIEREFMRDIRAEISAIESANPGISEKSENRLKYYQREKELVAELDTAQETADRKAEQRTQKLNATKEEYIQRQEYMLRKMLADNPEIEQNDTLKAQYDALTESVKKLGAESDKISVQEKIRFREQVDSLTRNLQLQKQEVSDKEKLAKVTADCAKEQANFNQYLKTVNPKGLREYASQIAEINRLFDEGNLGEAQNKVKELQAAFKNLGYEGGNAVTYLQSKVKALFTYLVANRIMSAFASSIREAVQAVKDIDAAMTQLQIVTGASQKKMEQFLTSATTLAKGLGQSVTDVLGSIETFSRLGFDLADASALAEYAGILSNVANVDTSEATTGLTAIIKGYNMNVSDAEHVADVLVQVGQKYAVSASELMEAFEKSGAALNATGTSFEKSAGLIAAANAAVQDASVAGTALKTISSRIRGKHIVPPRVVTYELMLCA